MEQQQRLMEHLVSMSRSASATSDAPSTSSDTVMDADKLDDAEKVRLVLRKLEPDVFDKYADYILPKVPRDLDFRETVSTLKTIFGRKESLFSARINCLQFTKSCGIDFVTYGAMVNRNCDNFEFGKLKENHFKCLMFLRGLQSAEDTDIRARLLNLLEGDTEGAYTIDKMVTEVHRVLSLKKDAAIVEQKVHAVKSKEHKGKLREKHNPNVFDLSAPNKNTSSSNSERTPTSENITLAPGRYSAHQLQHLSNALHQQ
ncbi:hypothetical protein CVS40_8616 [Lucilia cuprina]|nr:hypothetical protein CVS40_8616 [Lucilia cuprina]